MDPYEVITAGLDGFCAYESVSFGKLEDLVFKLSDGEMELWSEWEAEYLQAMQDYGARGGVKHLKEQLYNAGAPPAETEPTHYRDEALKAMKNLLSVTSNAEHKAEIQKAIDERIATLEKA
jgi:hypothetical protein